MRYLEQRSDGGLVSRWVVGVGQSGQQFAAHHSEGWFGVVAGKSKLKGVACNVLGEKENEHF